MIDTKIDISVFDRNYRNDETGASAIPPGALLKLVLYGYSKGSGSSRRLWELNRNTIRAKALTRDIEVHWTTRADFISAHGERYKEVCIKVLTYCNELGLLGNEPGAVDGRRLPSNASLHLSGTKEELDKRLTVYKRMAEKLMERRKRRDERGEAGEPAAEQYEEWQKKLNQQIAKTSGFLETYEARAGTRGQEIRSNVTDNKRAVILSPQGYSGIAAADAKNQIRGGATAAGDANECGHFSEMLDNMKKNLEEAGVLQEEAGYASKESAERGERERRSGGWK